MYNIKTLNKIASCGLNLLDKRMFTVSDECENPDGIILRSFNMHEMELGDNLKAIARAGAGTNNIPVDKCSEKGIVVFNTPGANANAVKELVLAGLLLSSRKITDGINWANTLSGDDVAKQVEKGKKEFVGPELEGKTLGVIGLGAIGVMVANAAYHLGMEVVGYDPYISVSAAWGLSRHVKKADNLEKMVEDCDYISVHVPLMDATRGMIDEELLNHAKKGVRVLNFARGELVNNADMKKALEEGVVSCYVTDFPTEEVIGMKNTICIPHLGASTPESEDNCAVMASKEIDNFLVDGNIRNSVNFPNCELPRETKCRITIAHMNVPNMLTTFSKLMSDDNINISNMINKSKKDYAYTIIDIDEDVDASIISEIEAVDNVLKARIIK